MSTELVRYDAMCRAIADSYKVDEVKVIRDKAAALEHYARQAHNVEAERQCCEIRLRAEKKAGRISKQLTRAQGRRSDLGTCADAATKSEVLTKAGISRNQAAQWEKLADVSDELFEAALAGEEMPTTTGIINSAGSDVSPVSKEALWLWGRLRDFERDGVLDADPEQYLDRRIEHMTETVKDLAPRVAAWLNEVREKLNDS